MRERRPGVWQLIVSMERKHQRLIDSLTKMDRLGQRMVAHQRERLYETVARYRGRGPDTPSGHASGL